MKRRPRKGQTVWVLKRSESTGMGYFLVSGKVEHHPELTYMFSVRSNQYCSDTFLVPETCQDVFTKEVEAAKEAFRRNAALIVRLHEQIANIKKCDKLLSKLI